MAVNPQIASIIASAYNKMAVMSLSIVRNFDDGYGMSQTQQELLARLVKTTNLVGELARFVEFDEDGNYVAVHRLTDTVVNDLLKSLIKVSDLDSYPVAPRIFYRNYPNIISGSGGGGSIGTLGNGQLYVGDSNNIAVARTPGGVISMTNTGVFSFTAGAIFNADINASAGIVYSKLNLTGGIVNADINASAAIAYSKLNLSGSIVNADISASAAITRTKIANGTANRILINDASGVFSENAAITGGRAIVSNASTGLPEASVTTATEITYVNGATSNLQTQINGKQATITGAASTVVSANLGTNKALVSGAGGKIEVHPNTTLTEIGYVNGVTSPIQTQLNSRLSVTLTSPAEGDIIMYNGSAWVNLARGTDGQALYTIGTTIQWDTPTINGIPVGGSTNQVLAKTSGFDFAADWVTPTLSFIGDVTASAAEVNVLQGITATTTQLNYVTGATSNLQAQINNKLSSALAQNAIFVGNASNVAAQLAAGSEGQVLTVVSGAPQWQTVTGTGTVTSVAVSGGTTGLTTSGGPISTSGTITLSGTLVVANGGTGLTALGSALQVLRVNAGATALEYASIGGVTGLTTNRVPFATSSSTLGDSANFTWDGANNAISVSRILLTPTVTLAGLNVGGVASSPGTLSNGDIWYNTTNHAFVGRRNSQTINFVTGGLATAGHVPFVSTPGSNLASSSSFIWDDINGALGIGAASPSARLHVIKTTEQLRVGYNTSIYYSTTVDSSGRVNLATVGGAVPVFIFGNNTIVNANLSVGASFTASAFLDVRGTTEQIRIAYDVSNYTSFTTGSTGNLTLTPTGGNFNVAGSLSLPYRAISSTSTASATDYTIDCTSGTFTLNLPTAVGITGRIYAIRNSGAGVITLDPNGSETLDGAATQTLTASQRMMIMSTGSNWISIAN